MSEGASCSTDPDAASFCGLPTVYSSESRRLSRLSTEPQSFHHLLLALAAEHQRAMERLRADLQQSAAEPQEAPVLPAQEPAPTRASEMSRAEVAPGRASENSAGVRGSFEHVPDEVNSTEPKEVPHFMAEKTRSFIFLRSDLCRVPSVQATLNFMEGKFCCRRLAGNETFNCFSMLVILLNSVLQGWTANSDIVAAVKGEEPESVPGLQIASAAFTVCFCVEILIRVFGTGLWRCSCRKEEEWSWNLFDALIVLCDLAQSYWEFVGLPRENVNVVRMLRVFRITRTLRVVRLLRFFRELRMMIYSVIKSGSSLFWSFVLLSFTIYMFAVYFIQILSHHLTYEQLPETADLEQMKRMFGSLTSAEYSLYLAISGGVSWGEVSRLFIDIDPFHGVVFCVFVFFTTFAVLNIITGIFVETAVSSARNSQEELVQEQMHATRGLREDVRHIFQGADANSDGVLSFDEFEHFLGKKEMRAYLDTLGIGHETARRLFDLLDLDQSGEISLEEFIFGCLRLKGFAKSIDLASLMNHQRRMAREWRRFFKWAEGQFKRLHDFQKRVDGRLALFDPVGNPAVERQSLPDVWCAATITSAF